MKKEHEILEMKVPNLKDELIQRANNETIFSFFAPARINLIGEHIDYVGGQVMPATINLGIEAYACKSKNVEIKSMEFGKKWIIDNHPFEDKQYNPQHQFMNFVYGIIKELGSKLKTGQGFKLILQSSIPVAAGLSSSAAFGMLIIEVLTYLYKIKISKIEKAKLFRRVENNFIGLQSGIMDQFAIIFGKKNKFILLDTSNLKYKYIDSKVTDYKLILLSSNKTRELASSKYNERVLELQVVAKQIGHQFEKLSEIKDINILHKLNNKTLKQRLKHVITENKRVTLIKKHLKNMTGAQLGKILNESHSSLAHDYEVSCSELDFIHNNLAKLTTVFGSRMIGAGFGGCVLAVVSRDFNFLDMTFHQAYKKKFGFKFDYYDLQIGDGIRQKND